MTKAETRLWRALRELGLPNWFRRQHPIGRYIVDFACPAAKLVIELDGGQRANLLSADELRSREIARRGYRVIRIWNGDVMANLSGVSEKIREELDVSLSALGGGEGRGRWGEPPVIARCGEAHLTLPIPTDQVRGLKAHDATGPRPLRPKGRRGR